MLSETLVAALLWVMPMPASSGYGARTSSLPPADSRVDTFRVRIPQLGGRQRTVRVYLPKGYDATRRAYPVLYLQDGQQLFAPGPFGDWLVDERMDELTDEDSAAAMIVVGVDNGEHRWDEYGPWRNDRMHAWVDPSWSEASHGGQGSAYVEFLAETLKPQIDAIYRTLPGREHTAVGGSSMGGLIALWAGLTRPDVFGRVMAMSPAFWFAESGGAWLSGNRFLEYARSHRLPRDVRFYLDVGTAERSRGAEPDVADADGGPVSYARAYTEGTLAAARALTDGGVPGAHVRLVVEAGAEHHEAAWSRRLVPALRWLFA